MSFKPCLPISARSTDVVNDQEIGFCFEVLGKHINRLGMKGKQTGYYSDQWSRGLSLLRKCYQVLRNNTLMSSIMTGISNCPPSLTVREPLILSWAHPLPKLKTPPCCSVVRCGSRCLCCGQLKISKSKIYIFWIMSIMTRVWPSASILYPPCWIELGC